MRTKQINIFSMGSFFAINTLEPRFQGYLKDKLLFYIHYYISESTISRANLFGGQGQIQGNVMFLIKNCPGEKFNYFYPYLMFSIF